MRRECFNGTASAHAKRYVNVQFQDCYHDNCFCVQQYLWLQLHFVDQMPQKEDLGHVKRNKQHQAYCLLSSDMHQNNLFACLAALSNIAK